LRLSARSIVVPDAMWRRSVHTTKRSLSGAWIQFSLTLEMSSSVAPLYWMKALVMRRVLGMTCALRP